MQLYWSRCSQWPFISLQQLQLSHAGSFLLWATDWGFSINTYVDTYSVHSLGRSEVLWSQYSWEQPTFYDKQDLVDSHQFVQPSNGTSLRHIIHHSPSCPRSTFHTEGTHIYLLFFLFSLSHNLTSFSETSNF